jgi:hypothetical protein
MNEDKIKDSNVCWICGEEFPVNFRYYIEKNKKFVKIEEKYIPFDLYDEIDESFVANISFGYDDNDSDDSDYEDEDDPRCHYCPRKPLQTHKIKDCPCICHSRSYIEKVIILKKAIKERKFKVRDHDHITGEFRGWAHAKCNLKLNIKNQKIPVLFHNGSGFDFHLILKYLPVDIVKEITTKKEVSHISLI